MPADQLLRHRKKLNISIAVNNNYALSQGGMEKDTLKFEYLAHPLAYGFFSGSTALSYLSPEGISPQSYGCPRSFDLQMVGQDMWSAFVKYDEETKKTPRP